MAPDAKFTEQRKCSQPATKLWRKALSTSTTFKIPVADPVTGDGMIVMMKASAAAFRRRRLRERTGSHPKTPPRYQLALRLKVVDRRITRPSTSSRASPRRASWRR